MRVVAPLLSDILEDLKTIATRADLEPATWKDLVHVLIGIGHSLILHSDAKISPLKRDAFRVLFDVIILGRMSSDDEWRLLRSFTEKWSEDVDFATIWMKRVQLLCDVLVRDLYSLPREAIRNESYNREPEPRDRQDATFFLTRVTALSVAASVRKRPELLDVFVRGVDPILNMAAACSTAKEVGVFVPRFPGDTLCRLLLPHMVQGLRVGESAFDSGEAVNVTNLVRLAAMSPGSRVRLVSLVLWEVEAKHAQVINSFLKNAVQLLWAAGPLVAVARAIVEVAPLAGAGGPSEQQSYLSAVLSASEILGVDAAAPALTGIKWLTDNKVKFQLASYAPTFALGLDGVAAFFGSSFVQMATGAALSQPHFVEYIYGLVTFLGTSCRLCSQAAIRAEDILRSVIREMLVVARNIPKPSWLMTAVAQAALTVLQYAQLSKETATSILDFARALESWPDLKSMRVSIQSRLGLASPLPDDFCRAVDSGASVNEQSLALFARMSSASVNFYTVGDSLLVSALESGQQLALFARGLFGKAAFLASDVWSEGLRRPAQVEVEPFELPRARPYEVEGQPTNLSRAFDAVDEATRTGNKRYSEWLGGKDLHVFDSTGTQMRPRVVDFLSTTGLLDDWNSARIRPQKDMEKLADAITRLNQLDCPWVLPIRVEHLLTAAKRMTPNLFEFLRTVGESVEFQANSATARNLPVATGPLPAIPVFTGFAVFFAEALCATWPPALNTQITIYFNDSEFEVEKEKLDQEHSAVVLVIRPLGSGLYHVAELKGVPDIVSPFGRAAVLGTAAIAFGLSLLVDEMAVAWGAPIDAPERRREVIQSLTEGEPDPTLGPMASSVFAQPPAE